MDFKSFAYKRWITEKSEESDSKKILNDFKDCMKSVEDFIQLMQLRLLFDCPIWDNGCEKNFITYLFELKDSNDLQTDIQARLRKLSDNFDNNKISVHIYAYYLYSISILLFFSSGECPMPEEVKWIDPRKDDLKDVSFSGNMETFGTGYYEDDAKDFKIEDGVLVEYTGQKGVVTVPDGVREICGGVFEKDSHIEYLFLPDTLQKLPKGCFSNMNAIKMSYMPHSVLEIPERLFEGCKTLRFVWLDAKVTRFGKNAFRGCECLQVVKSGAGFLAPKEIESGAFEGCGSLTLAPRMKGVQIIGDRAFYGCSKLTTIVAEGDVTRLGSSAFAECSNLENLKISYSGNTVPSYCFCGCEKLDVTDVLKSISRVRECGLKGVTIDSLFDLSSRMTAIGKEAFSGILAKDDRVCIPFGAVCEKGALRGVSISEIRLQSAEIKDSSGELIPLSLLFEPDDEGKDLISKVEKLVIDGGNIPDSSFKGWTGLKEVVLGDGVTCIPDSCFEGCSSLECVVIARTGLLVGDRAFCKCDKLAEIDVAGNRCPGMLDLTAFSYVGKSAFSGCLMFSSAQVGMPSVSESALAGCDSIESIHITLDDSSDSKLNFIGLFGGSVADFDMMTSYPRLRRIKMTAFGKIPEGFFEGASSLSDISIVDGPVFSIGKHAFDGCLSLENLDVNAKVTVLDECVFRGCSRLRFRNWFESVETLKRASLDSVCVSSLSQFPKLRRIEKDAFWGCDCAIDELDIPAGVEICPGAFRGIRPSKIRFSVANLVSGSNRILPYEMFSADCDSGFALQDVESISDVEVDSGALQPMAFEGWSGLKTVRLSSDILQIPNSCFMGCASLERVILNSSSVSVGDRAFDGCASLRLLEINGDGVEGEIDCDCLSSIGYSAFCGCAGIKAVRLHADRTDSAPFKGCMSLEKVFVDLSNCEESCVQLSHMIEGDSHDARFSKRFPKLKKVEVKASGTIPEKFFKDISGIREITVVDGPVKNIGRYAFSGCSSLASINMVFEGNVLKEGVFKGCGKLDLTDMFGCVKTLKYGSLDTVRVESLSQFPSLSKIESGAFIGSKCEFDFLKIPMGLRCCPGSLEGITAFDVEFEDASAFCYDSECLLPYRLFADSIDEFCKLQEDHPIKHLHIESGKLPSAAFSNWLALETVSLGGGVEVIPASCFENCKSLSSVVSLLGHVRVGASAFKGCESLTGLNLVVDNESIERSAFEGCSSLSCVKIPNAINVEENAFAGCRSIVSIEIGCIGDTVLKDVFSDGYAGVSSVTFNGEFVPDEYFSDMSSLREVFFADPDKIERIGRHAFSNCKDLKHIDKTPNLKVLRSFAFENVSLQEVELPSEIEYIGCGVFSGCRNLKDLNIPILDFQVGDLFSDREFKGSVRISQRTGSGDCVYYIPKSFKKLEVSRFSGCEGCMSGLNNIDRILIECDIIDVPDYCFFGTENCRIEMDYDKIVSIGAYSFAGSSAKIGRLPSVCRIGAHAFEGCGMNALELGNAVCDISFDCFERTGIREIVFKGNDSYENFNGVIISKPDDVVRFANKNISGSLELPNHVRGISDGAFSFCDQLIEIKLNSVECIGDRAFWGCASLKTADILGNVSKIGKEIFGNCEQMRSVSIPFLGDSAAIGKGLDYLFGDRIPTGLSLKIRGGKLISGIDGKNRKFVLIDLSEMDIECLEFGQFSNMEIDQLILPDRTVAGNGCFSHVMIGKLKADGMDHDDNFLYAKCDDNSEFKRIIYCYNPSFGSNMVIGKKIREISVGAFENIEKPIDGIVIESESLASNGCFKKLVAGKLDLRGEYAKDLILGDEFKGSSQSISSIRYFGHEIGERMLDGLENVRELEMDCIDRVPDGFFKNSSVLEFNSISLKRLKAIGSETFEPGMGIGCLKIGDDLQDISAELIVKIDIGAIDLSSNNKRYAVVDGMLMDRDSSDGFSLIYACKSKYGHDIDIPDSVTNIGSMAFARCAISDGLSIRTNNTRKICDFAFKDLRGKFKFYAQDCVGEFGCGVLEDDEVIEIRIPFVGRTLDSSNEDEKGGMSYFFNLEHGIESPELSRIESIEVGIQERYGETFKYCSGAKSIVVAECAQRIGANCFEGCSSISEFKVPKDVTMICDYAFKGCYGLKCISVPDAMNLRRWGRRFRVIGPRFKFLKNLFSKKPRIRKYQLGKRNEKNIAIEFRK